MDFFHHIFPDETTRKEKHPALNLPLVSNRKDNAWHNVAKEEMKFHTIHEKRPSSFFYPDP